MTSVFKRSFRELGNIRCLTVTGVLIALHVVIETFTMIDFGGMKINFAFVGLAAIGMLFGPAVAVIAAIPCDILPVLMRGYTFMPVYTGIAMLEGLIYGILLYSVNFDSFRGAFEFKSIPKYIRIIIARMSVVLICQVVLNTVMNFIYGPIQKTFFVYFLGRLVKNAVEFPVDIVILVIVLPVIKGVYTKVVRTA